MFIKTSKKLTLTEFLKLHKTNTPKEYINI
jgi:hypothetical protein